MRTQFTEEETSAMIASHDRWFHQIDVGHGIQTPGTRNPTEKLRWLDLPEDLTGWSVLDIGANDGFFSFECEERGAARVLATDHTHWTGEAEYMEAPRKAKKGQFEVVRELRGSLVHDETISVYDLDPEELGTFDLVMMYGVLYHLAHPTVGLEKAIQMSEKLIIVESAVQIPTCETPLMVYTPGPSWWYPNPECIKGMLLLFGCEEAKIIPGLEGKARTVVHGYRNGYRGEVTNGV